jgi:hypothetical protein
MKSRQMTNRFDLVSEALIKEIMSGTSRKFKKHFQRVYNGFRGTEIPICLVRSLLCKPEYTNSILFKDKNENFQFLTRETLKDQDFLYYYEDLDKPGTLTGIIVVAVDAFVELKDKLNL